MVYVYIIICVTYMHTYMHTCIPTCTPYMYPMHVHVARFHSGSFLIGLVSNWARF